MTSTDTCTAETAVRALFSELYAAWAAGDAFAALYRPDATVVMPGVFHRGRDVVRDYMAAAFAGPLRGSRGLDEPRDIRFLGADTAVVVSTAGHPDGGRAGAAERARAHGNLGAAPRGRPWPACWAPRPPR